MMGLSRPLGQYNENILIVTENNSEGINFL